MFSSDGTTFVHIWLPPNLNSGVMKPLAFVSSHPGRISFHWAAVITTLEPNGKPLKWEPPFLLHGNALFTFHRRAAIRLKIDWRLAML